MAKEMVSKKRRDRTNGSITVPWDHERTQSEENQMIEGVGRAGAPIQSLEVPGVSDKSTNQTRDLGNTRLRISRPGVCEAPLNSPKIERKIK